MKPAAAALAVALAACAVGAGCSRRDTGVRTGDRAQVLHRGIGADLADLDPHLATQASDYTVLSSLLEGLLGEDPVDLHPVPGVAERWEVSPDGLTYTFHLRAGARWSDGLPVTSQDFVGSWRRMLTPELAATNASQLFLIRGAEDFYRGACGFEQVGVRAPDARTLAVVLEHPAPWFPSMLSSPAWLPVSIATVSRYGPVSRRGNPWAAPGTWVGNGPFVLKSWRHGQEIVVARSPTYWDAGRVRLREIHFHAFDSLDAEERAFRAGQLHVTEALPPDRIGAYRRDAPGLLRIDPLLGTYFLRVNVRRPGLSDARVRLALALAVDRTAIVERLLMGGQRPAYSFTPPGLGAYEPAQVQRGQPAEARRLLAESGHPGGRGLPALELLYNNSETHRVIAEAIQEMWRRELGVRLSLVNEELKSTEEARRAGAYDLLRSSLIADYADPSYFLEVWRGDSANNFTGWSSAAYDSLLFDAARSGDPARRGELYLKAEKILLSEAPVIPLYFYTHVFLIRPSVRGWSPTLLDHHPYKDVWLED
ncbi:MAG: peptide ABC transporter substrate-binding protein [Opitutaceae bacterium]